MLDVMFFFAIFRASDGISSSADTLKVMNVLGIIAHLSDVMSDDVIYFNG